MTPADNGTPAGQPAPPSNFFRPRPGYMARKVRLIRLVLLGWAAATFGLSGLLVFLQRTPRGASVLTDLTLLGFPLHFWLTGQLVILFFVLLCLFFNVGVDRLRRQLPPRQGGGR